MKCARKHRQPRARAGKAVWRVRRVAGLVTDPTSYQRGKPLEGSAGSGTRTRKGLSPPDFESGASTNSTIPAAAVPAIYEEAKVSYMYGGTRNSLSPLQLLRQRRLLIITSIAPSGKPVPYLVVASAAERKRNSSTP